VILTGPELLPLGLPDCIPTTLSRLPRTRLGCRKYAMKPVYVHLMSSKRPPLWFNVRINGSSAEIPGSIPGDTTFSE
jgi:hypothetical protein